MDLPEENNTAQENVDADTAVSASSADAVKEAVVEKSADAVEETVVEKTEEEKKAELAANGGLEELSPAREAEPALHPAEICLLLLLLR